MVAEKGRNHKRNFIGMLILSLAICIAVGSYFWMMSHPAEENLSYSLYPNQTESFDWSYRVDGEEMVPQFDEMGYLPSFPVEGEVCIVEASRVMTEERQEGLLRFMDPTGIQVYLENKLIYTDFPEADNQFGTFLPWNAEIAATQQPRMERYVLLPPNYVGKTLIVVSYSMVYGGLGSGCYPELYESTMLQGGFIPGSVLPVTSATVAAVLGVLLLFLFLFGLWNGAADWSSLLLVLFAFLSMVAFSGESFPVSFAIPGGGTPEVIYFIKAVTIDALLFYFAVQMKKSHGILLATAAGAHVLLHGLALVHPYQIFMILQSAALPILLLVTLVLMMLEYKRQTLFRLLLWSLLPITLVFCILILISPKDANANGVYLAFTTALQSGNWMPMSLILSTMFSLLSALLLIVHYIRWQVRERLEIQSYQIQTVYQQKNIENLTMALNGVKGARHEYRHHLETLWGLVDVEGQQRAKEYLESIIAQEQDEPSMQLSEHPVVNAVLSMLYRKAKQENIEVKTSVKVSERIAVTDTDLSLMMTNMIENAFEAILQMPDDQKRYIHLKIGLVDEHIFYLGCENSYIGLPFGSDVLPTSTKQDLQNHGFGLVAIRRIAEKYHGFLVVSGDGATFKTQVRMNLPNDQGTKES